MGLKFCFFPTFDGYIFFYLFFTIQPSWIMLLCSDWMMISQRTENSKVPSHEISRCARVQLPICQWEKWWLGTNVQPWIECVLPGTNQGRDQTHRSEVRPRAFWGHRGFSRGRSRNARQVERCYPVVERVKVQHEASKSHIGPGKRYIYSLCFKLHQILIIAHCIRDGLHHKFRPDMSNNQQ